MKKAYLLLVFLCFALTSVIAQPSCGFDILNKKKLATDPEYARSMQQTEVAIQDFIRKQRLQPQLNRGQAVYTVPVVVHVMHTGGAIGSIYNPTDAQIVGAINYLNQVYAGTYPGMTPPDGIAVGDMGIQFALAQRTPACGATNGIDRVDMSGVAAYVSNGVNSSASGGISDLTLKNAARWNPANYYNIWVVNEIDDHDGTSGQFIAGYAYFAGAPASVDGTVMLATQITTGQKTLPHEIGHAFNLYHTFEGSGNVAVCPPNTGDCLNEGDRVCDTDPVSNNFNGTTYNFSCRTSPNTCITPNAPHNIYTESNFMAYTNCYTLFTAGQKLRTDAALSVGSRASLVDPSNLALVPCGTLLNFNTASDAKTEDITGTLTGCRRYRDYTYQMTIGTGPSAAATATLTYSGTAIKGLDYEVTTNGNFASPSNVMNFAAGSTTAQTFTVRIYDDFKVEAPNTAIIDFTVNNGGGNAAKGTTTPTLTITIADNDVAPVGTSSGTYSVGTIAFGTSAAPFDARLQSERSQFLYKASELATAGITAGNITAIQLFINTKASTRPYANLTIKMGHASVDYLVDGSVITVASGLTTVYTNASYSTIAGWNTFTLSTPFVWNGLSSLAVEICYDNGTADAANGGDQIGLYSDGGLTTQRNLFFQPNINCATSFSSITYFNSGVKPIIRLSNSVTGTPIETVVSSTTNQHINVGSNDYFYSNNSRLMMRLSGISAALGCVTSTLENAGTSWVGYQGGQRSAKVFAVTPTTNIGTTGYTVALYFDNPELGGKVPGTLRLAKTTAASVATSNASNTIVVTPTVTTLGSGTTVFTANFTGFSRFFLVDAAVTLPVNLVEFTAKANDEKNTVVTWKTASEQNNKQFDVEISNDAVSFSGLTTVLSQGNSTAEKNYQYLHVRPPAGTSWYRLKQTDIDGHFKYSNIVAVTINKDIVKSFVYPVPSKDRVIINFGRLISRTNLEILTADMKTVRHETVTGPVLKKDINIEGLSRGVYFIKLTSDSGVELLRFVKE